MVLPWRESVDFGQGRVVRTIRCLCLGLGFLVGACLYHAPRLSGGLCVGESCADRASDSLEADGHDGADSPGDPGAAPGEAASPDGGYGDPVLAGDGNSCGECAVSGPLYCGPTCNYCCHGVVCDLSAECR